MSKFADDLKATTAKLDALLAPASTPAPAEEQLQLSAAEVVARISDEMLAGNCSPERVTYMKSVLDDLAKSHWEQTTYHAPIKIVDDLTQLKPNTATIAPSQLLSIPNVPIPSNATHPNLLTKAQLIQKLLNDKAALAVAITKSKLTDKLDEIYKVFGISSDELETEYDLRWKVGDLITQLQSAVKLERLVDGVKKAEETKPVAEPTWPRDMTRAEFDPVAKAYKPETSPWDDAPSQR
jgi:hypothetical protein